MTRVAAAQLGRLGPAIVTGGMVLFASWTLVYQLALFTGLPAVPMLLAGLALGTVVLVGLRRFESGRGAHLVPLPGLRVTLLVLALTTVAIALGLAGHRTPAVVIAVVTAGGALVDTLRRSRHTDDDDTSSTSREQAETDDTAEQNTGLWLAGWVAALVSGALAAVIVRPNPDDAYFVNLSTWVAERGYFPLHDTMISPDRFPGLSSHSPPLHSVEGLIGAVARLVHLEAATVAYVIVPPVATVFGVLVLTWLVDQARIPAAPAGLLAAVAYLWTTGGTGYSFGGFFATRIWQGKSMLVSLVLPLVLLMGVWLLRRGGVRNHVMFAAVVVASLGMSNTAAFLVPVLIAGLVLAALALREPRGALRLVAWVWLPLVAGVVSALLAPAAATAAQRAAEGFQTVAAVDGGGGSPLRTVPGWHGVLVVTALAIGVGLLGVRELTVRTATLGVIVTGGIALLPPMDRLFELAGLGSVLWRMWWIIPVPLLVAGVVGAAAGRVTVPRTRAVVAVATASAVGLVPLVGGRWVGSEGNDARFAVPWAWKVQPGLVGQARFIERVSEPGDTVLAPGGTSRVLAALTVDVQPVSARRSYLPTYVADPEADAGSRDVLQEFADVTTPDDPTAVEDALVELSVDTVCLKNHRDGGIRLLEADGFTVVGSERGITCLRR